MGSDYNRDGHDTDEDGTSDDYGIGDGHGTSDGEDEGSTSDGHETSDCDEDGITSDYCVTGDDHDTSDGDSEDSASDDYGIGDDEDAQQKHAAIAGSFQHPEERQDWNLAIERQQLLDDYANSPSGNTRKVTALASFLAGITCHGATDDTSSSTFPPLPASTSSKWPSHGCPQYDEMFDNFIRGREGSTDPLQQPFSRPEPWLNPARPGLAAIEDIPRIIKGSGIPSMANTAIILNYAPAKKKWHGSRICHAYGRSTQFCLISSGRQAWI